MKKLFLFMAVVAMVAPCYSLAAEVHVPAEQPTIQAGINAASNGDQVIVAPGTYVENINFNGKVIMVVCLEGPSFATIDGNQAGSVVTFNSGEGPSSIIDGFRITNGTGTFDAPDFHLGGGIYCDNGSSPTISNNVIEDNNCTGTGQGAGIYCQDSSSPVIINNMILVNSSQYGAGITCNGGAPRIETNWIEANTGHWGGGIYCFQASPDIVGNDIVDNTVTGTGGGIGSVDSIVEIISNTITGNTADEYAGGIACWSGTTGTISGNTLSANEADVEGGGLCCHSSSPLIADNNFEGNISYGSGGGITCWSSASQIHNNLIIGNQATDAGGGIECQNQDASLVMNNLILGNSAGYGAGARLYELDSVVFAHNTVTGNSATGQGGGLAVWNATPQIIDSILWGNSAPAGEEITVYGMPSDPTISFCDLAGGTAGAFIEPGCSLIEGAGMIDADPCFLPGPQGEHYLSQNVCGEALQSLCVDAGSGPAGDICFTLPSGAVCLDELTTLCVLDSGQVDIGFHYPPGPLTGTINAGFVCSPDDGTLPFQSGMTVTMGNPYTGQLRSFAARINMTTGSGLYYSSWRAGYTNVSPGSAYQAYWGQNFPALGSLIGENLFELIAEDVTPAPYNQPPYPPAGDTDTAMCTITGVMP